MERWRRPCLVANGATLPKKWPPPQRNVPDSCELTETTKTTQLCIFRVESALFGLLLAGSRRVIRLHFALRPKHSARLVTCGQEAPSICHRRVVSSTHRVSQIENASKVRGLHDPRGSPRCSTPKPHARTPNSTPYILQPVSFYLLAAGASSDFILHSWSKS